LCHLKPKIVNTELTGLESKKRGIEAGKLEARAGGDWGGCYHFSTETGGIRSYKLFCTSDTTMNVRNDVCSTLELRALRIF